MSRLARPLTLFTLFLLLISSFSTPVLGLNEQSIPLRAALPAPQTAPPDTSAAAAVLLEPQSGTLLMSKNPDERRPMASTTKIMTALVVLEACPLSDVVTVPAAAVGVEGSSVYLFEGERLTVETLLYALLLSSANDAATALAIHTAGSVAAFADRMNEKAAAMGLENTHFMNPHGLHHEAHYTTARDLAKIAAAALQNEVFAGIVSTKRYSAPPNADGSAARLFVNHNRLLHTYEGAVGVKTGYTRAGGRCLVSAANREGLMLIAVTLQDRNDWCDHAALLDWGFSAYECVTPALPTISLPVVGGTVPEVQITAETLPQLILPRDHGKITVTTELPRFLFAGLEAGKTVGRVILREDDEIITVLPLKVANGVEKAPQRPSLFQKIKDAIFHF